MLSRKLEIPTYHLRTFPHRAFTAWNMLPSFLIFIKQWKLTSCLFWKPYEQRVSDINVHRSYPRMLKCMFFFQQGAGIKTLHFKHASKWYGCFRPENSTFWQARFLSSLCLEFYQEAIIFLTSLPHDTWRTEIMPALLITDLRVVSTGFSVSALLAFGARKFSW